MTPNNETMKIVLRNIKKVKCIFCKSTELQIKGKDFIADEFGHPDFGKIEGQHVFNCKDCAMETILFFKR